MALTLDTVTLPDVLSWNDEFEWSPVTHSKSYGVTGSLFVQVGDKLAGRDITLVGSDSMGWITRDIVEDLQTLRDADTEMTLTLQDARTFTVRWKQEDNCIDVDPLVAHNQFSTTMYYKVNALRLFQVPDP